MYADWFVSFFSPFSSVPDKHLKIGAGYCSCHSQWEDGVSATSVHTYLFRPSPSYQSPIWSIIFDPKYWIDVKSRPQCCMHGKSMLTEFLHGSHMLWEWWGESNLHVHPTAQPMLGMCSGRHTFWLSSGFVDWSCNHIAFASELATPLLFTVRNVQKP
jgi:hypothetical protein